MTLADIAAEMRDADALLRYAPALEELANRDNHKLYLAIAQRALGVAHRLSAEYPEAEDLLKQALGLFTKLGTRWQIGRTLFELGELHRNRSNIKAREYYSQALGSFEEIQSIPYVERVRGALNSLG